MIVAATGHRPDKIGQWNPNHTAVGRVRTALRDALTAKRPLYALSGMALGTDQWFAEACIDLSIPFIACVPCEDMDRLWPPIAQRRFKLLINKAKEVVNVSPGPYQPWKMQKRNEYLVDYCNLLFGVWDGSNGGTANCLAYAAKVGRDVMLLDWQVNHAAREL